MGFRIKEVRQQKGMTQEELSKKSGVSRFVISTLESGARKNTTTETLVAIASAMEVTVSDIFFADTV